MSAEDVSEKRRALEIIISWCKIHLSDMKFGKPSSNLGVPLGFSLRITSPLESFLHLGQLKRNVIGCIFIKILDELLVCTVYLDKDIPVVCKPRVVVLVLGNIGQTVSNLLGLLLREARFPQTLLNFCK